MNHSSHHKVNGTTSMCRAHVGSKRHSQTASMLKKKRSSITAPLDWSLPTTIISLLSMSVQKTLIYVKTELFTNFGNALVDSRKDLLNSIAKKDYNHDSNNTPGLQTTANFKIALKKYPEAVTNKVSLCDVQIRYLQVRCKYTKNPFKIVSNTCIVGTRCTTLV